MVVQVRGESDEVNVSERSGGGVYYSTSEFVVKHEVRVQKLNERLETHAEGIKAVQAEMEATLAKPVDNEIIALRLIGG